MGVKVKGRYVGKLGTELVHEESGTTMRTAAPKDNLGDGSSFSPTDLVGASLGSCVLTTMAIVAERNGIDVKDSWFDVEKTMGQGPRRISQLDLKVHLPASISEIERRKLEAAAETCPVKHSLSKDLMVNMQIIFDL